MFPRASRGFTLIELLVVMAILAVLTGLVLGGVQKVRHAAARTACANQIRQIALALQAHDAQHHKFPIGYRSRRPQEPLPYSGWPLSLLPYVEQSPLYDASMAEFARQVNPFGTPLHAGFPVVVPAYLCPSDPRIREPQTSKRTKHLVAFTSYLGVAGGTAAANDGVLFMNRAIRPADITDGASNTLLLGERPPSADFQFGWWYAGNGQRGRGTADMTLSVREPNLQPIVSGSTCGSGEYRFTPATGFDDPCGMFHFWSPHPGGANFAFGDGSVRFLRYAADAIMPALATRAGGESVEIP